MDSHKQNLKDRKLPARVRFWKRVNKNGPTHPTLDRCWDWVGYSRKDGYGILGVGGNLVKVHKYSWELANGEIPSGLSVLHQCDRPCCVNPNHLYLGTQQDNIRDMSERDRIPLGEDKWSAKLTVEIVLEIRKVYKPFCRRNGTHALARRFGVSGATVQAIIKRKKWKHV